MVNGKISWLDFCERYIINIQEEQNLIEDPSKEQLAQDVVSGTASLGTLATK